MKYSSDRTKRISWLRVCFITAPLVLLTSVAFMALQLQQRSGKPRAEVHAVALRLTKREVSSSTTFRILSDTDTASDFNRGQIDYNYIPNTEIADETASNSIPNTEIVDQTSTRKEFEVEAAPPVSSYKTTLDVSVNSTTSSNQTEDSVSSDPASTLQIVKKNAQTVDANVDPSFHQLKHNISKVEPQLLLLQEVENPLRNEKRLFDSVTVALRFPVSGGLTNQHYAELTGLVIGLELGADTIIMPPPFTRNVYHENSLEQQWTPYNLSDLYDMESIHSLCQKRGVNVQKAPFLRFDEYLHHPKLPADATESQVITLPEIYLKMRNLSDLVAEIRHVIYDHFNKLSPDDRNRLTEGPGPHSMLYPTFNLPPLMAVQLTNEPLALEVARHLAFAEPLRELANTVITRMASRMGVRMSLFRFNGVHLRIATDAQAWMERWPDKEVGFWRDHSEAAAKLQFGNLPLFVATAAGTKWSTGPNPMLATAHQFAANYSVVWFTKAQLLSEEELSGLNSEQSAAIDLLVLSKADKFVGFAFSTFSRFVAEARLMNGYWHDSHVLVAKGDIHPGAYFTSDDPDYKWNGNANF